MTIDERIAAELRSHAPKVDEHAAWDRIRSAAPVHRRSRTIRLVAVPVAAVGFLLVASILVSTVPSGPAPASGPQSPFLGTWVSTDGDGSTQTMVIEVSEDGTVEVAGQDDYASVCSGAPSTMVGTGQLEGSTALVVASPVLTCDNGSEPQALSGPPLEEQLQNLTFVHHSQTDALTDNFGVVWHRVGSEVPDPEPTTPILWPQSSLEEVREAQRLADAGDPDFTWQLEPGLEESLMTTPAYLDVPEIFARFLREELGWEEFSRLPGPGFGDGTISLTYVRCAPGESNPIYPDDPRGGRCAPTIDDVRYETVEITVAQPVRQDSSGIWVVTQWETVEPVEQVVPLTESDATEIMEAFLQARIAGEGAERYFGGGGGTAPLLYATSTGAPFERYEFELVSGPEWPDDWMRFEVRLFAEDGQTVVEQSFTVERDEAGRWGLETGSETLESGQALPGLHDILGGEVTFSAVPAWDYSFAGWDFTPTMETLLLYNEYDERVVLLADPLPVETGCEEGPAPADAEALAQSIRTDPDLEVSEPVAVSVGGIEGVRMDVVATPGASNCDYEGWPAVLAATELNDESHQLVEMRVGSRMRLYLLDLPEEISARILAVAIAAPEQRFDQVVKAAAPIVDSVEFHTR